MKKISLSVFKKFNFTVLLTFLALYTIFITANFFYYKNFQDCFWLKSIYQKKLEYSSSIKTPKLILLGGSNLLFSVKAQTLEEKLKMPVLNLGTHAGLGLIYILDKAKKEYIKPGDTVLLSIEYELYNKNDKKSKVYNSYIVNYDKAYLNKLSIFDKSLTLFLDLSEISFKDFVKSLQQQYKFKKSGTKALDYYIYNSENLDRNGDQLENIGHKKIGSDQLPRIKLHLTEKLDINTAPMKALSNFLEWCKCNKVKVIYTYPTIPYYDKCNNSEFKVLQKDIKEYFTEKNISILDTSGVMYLKDQMFFDTIYHLNYEGRDIRTASVAKELEKMLLKK